MTDATTDATAAPRDAAPKGDDDVVNKKTVDQTTRSASSSPAAPTTPPREPSSPPPRAGLDAFKTAVERRGRELRAAVAASVASTAVMGRGRRRQIRRVLLHTGPHTTASARWTPILKDFSRRLSPPRVPRFQSRHTSTPFNSASDAFQPHPDIIARMDPRPSVALASTRRTGSRTRPSARARRSRARRRSR